MVHKREMYAKVALLMFYPFQKLNDLKYDGSYWKLFHNELEKHITTKTTRYSGRKDSKYCKILKTDHH
jgi:hypothetical protein